MLQEWKETWALVRKWTDESEEEERATEATAWAILLREFLERHRVTLASPVYARWDFPFKAAEKLQLLADTARALQQAEGTQLQKVANRAEAHQAKHLEMLGRLVWLEAFRTRNGKPRRIERRCTRSWKPCVRSGKDARDATDRPTPGVGGALAAGVRLEVWGSQRLGVRAFQRLA
jgi:hypothetical protein